MININELMTPKIIERHTNYIIKTSKILTDLKQLKKKGIIELSQSYTDSYNNNKSITLKIQDIENYFKIFINFLVGEVETLNEDNIENIPDDNIFIAKPEKLNVKLKKIEKKHTQIVNILKWECELTLKSSGKVKPVISKAINEAFGYKEFIERTMNTSEYIKFINSLQAPYGKYYSLLKEQSRTITSIPRYTSERLKYIKERIREDLQKYSLSNKLNELHDQIINEVMNINTGSEDIKKFINEVIDIVKKYNNKCKNAFNDVDVTTLNYNKFFSNSNQWSGYHLVMMLGVKTCPYCNRQYITPSFHEKDGCIRADLDHFYPKSKYPYLSMSLYNLIPCCKFCNSSLKLKKDFNYETHINPYERGFDGILKFNFKPIKYDLTSEKKDKVEIMLELDDYSILEESQRDNLLKKAKNNAEVFKLESLYNYHRHEVEDLILKRIIYSKEYISEIKKNLENICSKTLTNKEVIEFLISNYIREEKLHEKTLAKLYKDIARELNLVCNENDNIIDISEKDRKKLKDYLNY